MHFPPVKNLCPAVSGESTECVCGGGKADTRPLQKPPVHPLKKGDTGGAWFLSAPNEDNARRAECPPPCNSPASRRGADGSSFASYLLGKFLPMANFRPGGLAASVHPCAHSAVRVGFPTPFLLGRHLAVFRPLRYPPHSILGHDSLSGPVSPQSHSYHTRFPWKSQRSAPCKTALYCRTAKNRRSGAESPCFAGKKDV